MSFYFSVGLAAAAAADHGCSGFFLGGGGKFPFNRCRVLIALRSFYLLLNLALCLSV